jgi:hypothetical protein
VTRIQHFGTHRAPIPVALPLTRARGAALARVQLTPTHLSVRCSVLLYLVSATSSRLSRAGKSKCRASDVSVLLCIFSALTHSGTTSLHVGWMVGPNTTTTTTTTTVD